MLLVVDVGNSNIVLGIYRDQELIAHWRLATNVKQTCDEYGMMLLQLMQHSDLDSKQVDGSIISCVVPPLLQSFEAMVRIYFNVRPLVVGPGIKTGMPILYDNPREVGADRIVNAVAAYERFKRALIVVDFGTATTLDAISERGEYLGGAICPGITISMEALFLKASKLPRVELTKPKRVIGRNTVNSIQSGILYGYAGLVDRLIERMSQEMDGSPVVIATGGLAERISIEATRIEHTDNMLTLEGLRVIFERNP
ncbi:MAG: type III pantothenate kinase [Candidatus Alcyoniella australis]|nr:type III pantothenate kinase [Candidatus Alcyoniella australis]